MQWLEVIYFLSILGLDAVWGIEISKPGKFCYHLGNDELHIPVVLLMIATNMVTVHVQFKIHEMESWVQYQGHSND